MGQGEPVLLLWAHISHLVRAGSFPLGWDIVAAGVFLFECVFWSQDQGEESPVNSILETDLKEAGLTEGRGTSGKQERPEGLEDRAGPASSVHFYSCSQVPSSVTKM